MEKTTYKFQIGHVKPKTSRAPFKIHFCQTVLTKSTSFTVARVRVNTLVRPALFMGTNHSSPSVAAAIS